MMNQIRTWWGKNINNQQINKKIYKYYINYMKMIKKQNN